MLRRLLTVSVMALTFLVGNNLWAQDAKIKPIFVSSFAPIDDLFADFDYMANVFEAKDGATMVRQLVGPYLGGIDRKRPSGGYVLANGEGDPTIVLFVPVTSLKAELAILEQLIGKGEELEDGVFKFVDPSAMAGGEDPFPPAEGEAPAKPTEFFVKEKNKWAFLSDSAANLKNLPDDPIALLEGLDKKYDIGQRIIFENIDPQERQKLIDEMKKQIAEGRAAVPEEGAPELSPEWQAAMEKMLISYAEGTKSLDYGLTIDSKARNVALSLSVEPLPGSDLAKSLASAQTLTTNHSGVLLQRATVLFHRAAKLSKEDVAMWDQLAEDMIKLGPPRFESLPIEDQKQVKDAELLMAKVGKARHADGEVDWGGSYVVNDDGTLTIIAGTHLADLKGLESMLRDMLEKYKDKQHLKDLKIEWDVATHANVRIGKVQPPPDVRQDLKLLGDDPTVYFGIDGDYLYMALGKDSLTQLKEAIDRSASRPNFKVAPYRQRIDVAPIVKVYIEQAKIESPTVDRLMAKLAVAPGKTGVNINLLPSDAGLEGRLEIDEALFSIAPELGELIWQAIMQAYDMDDPLVDPFGPEAP